MARFTGDGNVTLAGTDARIHDFETSGTAILPAGRQHARNIDGPVSVTGADVTVTDSNLSSLAVSGTDVLITNCLVTGAGTVSGDRFRAHNNLFEGLQTQLVINADSSLISGNLYRTANPDTDDTYDAVEYVSGEGHLFTGNKVMTIGGGNQYSSAVNVTGTAVVIGNYFGGTADYATGPIKGAGSAIVTWPGGAYGDNFTS